MPELPNYSGRPTLAQRLVRELLHAWGLDSGSFGTASWNPLGSLIEPGSKVVIKPNWVYHAARGKGSVESLITDTSVIKAVLEYVALARPSSITLGDAPLQSCQFEVLRKVADLGSISEWARTNMSH